MATVKNIRWLYDRIKDEETAAQFLRERGVRCHPRGHPTVAPTQIGCVAYVHPSAEVNESRGGTPFDVAEITSGRALCVKTRKFIYGRDPRLNYQSISLEGYSHLAESRLADRSFGRQSFGRQVVWRTGRLADWSLGRQVIWPTGRLADWSLGRQVIWPNGRLADWSFGRQVVRPTGRLADRSFSLGG
ncbi:hypothetical protein M513_08449 [Trichuris suis]|uniref:Uncharacterized protein n=1 Tax=Trichuris suis TaxID=68888 RepID=A0A085M096_9BILA|nr:hypothetical protein M513_08449 [Trichuris suis]